MFASIGRAIFDLFVNSVVSDITSSQVSASVPGQAKPCNSDSVAWQSSSARLELGAVGIRYNARARPFGVSKWCAV